MSRAPASLRRDSETGFDAELREIARGLPAVLAGLRASYHELEERAARIERELAVANQERVELTERLHAADKLSALGTMAAGIAHEIRNPMNAVRGFAELLCAVGALDERARTWAQRIVEGVGEADAIIDNMLSFGSPERLRLSSVNGSELLDDAVRLALAGRKASDPPQDVDIRVRSVAPPFRGDEIKLRQAVRNLVSNAIHAQIETTGARIDVELVLEGSQVVFRVADAGPGVAAGLRTRILDPFFTTTAEGTGLGLALVSVIARLHGGSVHCSPEPSALGGALFELRVPFHPTSD